MKIQRCTAFKSCRRKAKYVSPGDWCSKRWKMWWQYGMKGKAPLPYMKKRSMIKDAASTRVTY